MLLHWTYLHFSKFLITLQAVNFSCTGCFCSFSKFLARKCAGEWSCKGLSACFPTLIKLQADMLLDWTFLFLIRISVLNICKWAHLDLVWIFVTLWAGKYSFYLLFAYFQNFLTYWTCKWCCSGLFCMFSEFLVAL